MNINWKVRVKNRSFWIALIPSILLVIQTIATLFGYKWDFVVLNQELAAVINAVFSMLAILGVVTDPTTPGISDSERAMLYDRPGETLSDR